MVLRIAHRGACAHAPGNSRTAFEKAIELGADMIELDVRKCATGELFVIHDDILDHETNGKGLVADHTAASLKNTFYPNGDALQTLDEIIRDINRRAILGIEIKERNTAEPLSILLESFFTQGWQPSDFIVFSFWHKEIAEFIHLSPEIDAGVTFACQPLNDAQLADHLGISLICPCHEFIDADLVADAHHRNLKVYTWTPNTKAEIDRVKKLNVDGIITDWIERV